MSNYSFKLSYFLQSNANLDSVMELNFPNSSVSNGLSVILRLQSVQHTTPSVLIPSIQIRKNSSPKKNLLMEKNGTTEPQRRDLFPGWTGMQ